MGKLLAVEYIEQMKLGWSQPHLIRCNDGQKYVIKFMNGPDGCGGMTNELIAWRLGRMLELPLAACQVVRVEREFIEMYPVLTSLQVCTGLHMGSRFVSGAIRLSEDADLSDCMNMDKAAGIIVFDHWIRNDDRHDSPDNVLFTKDRHLTFIDHSDAFFGPAWEVDNFVHELDEYPDDPNVLDLYWGPVFKAFAPYLDTRDPFGEYVAKIEALNKEDLRAAVHDLPGKWGIPREDQDRLVRFLLARKGQLRKTMDRLKAKRLRRWQSR